jgi:outer membrane lipoprotein-sorting protein
MGRPACVLLVCALAAAEQTGRVHDPILDHVVEAYTNVQGYQFEITTTDRIAGTSTDLKSRSLFIAYGAPDRLRLEDKDKNEITAYHDRGVSTAKNGSVGFMAPPEQRREPAHPPMRENPPLAPDQPLPMPGAIIPERTTADRFDAMTNDYAHRSRAIAKFGLTDYTAVEKDLKSAHLVRQEPVTVDGIERPCAVVEATYSHGETRTLWVDTRQFVVLREVGHLRGEGPTQGKEVEHTIALRTISWDQPSPQSLFDLRQVFLPDNSARKAYIATHPEANGARPPHQVQPCLSHIDTAESKIARLSGSVGLTFVVDTSGAPTDIKITQPLGLGVDALAAQCISLSQYLPAEKDGKPMPWKMGVNISVTGDGSSDWSLGRAQFLPEEGASRPVFLKTRFPGPQGAEGRIVVPIHLVIDKQGVPRDVEPVTPGMPKLDKMAVGMVNSWRFHPGLKDGSPVDVPANFDLVCGGGRNVIHVGQTRQIRP